MRKRILLRGRDPCILCFLPKRECRKHTAGRDAKNGCVSRRKGARSSLPEGDNFPEAGEYSPRDALYSSIGQRRALI